MKAHRRSAVDLLVLAGTAALVVLTLPLLAAGAFLLRAVFFVAVPIAALGGLTLWLTSDRFRTWVRTTGTIHFYKGLRLAPDVALDRGHAWTRAKGTEVTIGADDLVATTLGPLDGVELPPPGRTVLRGETLFRLKHGPRLLDVRAPVSGTVVATNKAVVRDPRLVNEDPFRRGWTVKMRSVAETGPQPADLRRGPDAIAWFRTEVDRAIAMVACGGAAAPAMADGGTLAADIYQHNDHPTWECLVALWRGDRS
jgi:glycine cleavage system H protein